MEDYEEENIIISTGRKSTKKIPDFNKYDLPDCIRNEARSVYQRLDISTHEGVRQKQVMYACFYIAGLICNMPQLPEKLRTILSLDARQASGANSYIFQAKNLGICKKMSILTPLMFVNSFLKEYCPEKYNAMMEMAGKLWTKLEKVEAHKSKHVQVLAAYIVYSLKVVTLEDVCRYFYVSEKDIKF